jgi:hypothetical protein
MPVYFGIPVNMNEAYRLFGLEKKVDDTCQSWDDLMVFLKEKGMRMELFATDKGQFILGYIIKEPSDVWTKFTNVDQSIHILTMLKTEFSWEIEPYKANFREVELEYMEGEPETVRFMVPYIIEYKEN